MTPEMTNLLMQTGAAALVLFVIAYIGNRLTFSNRFVNALVTAVLFGLFYGALAYTIDQSMLPAELRQASTETWVSMILIASALVFVVDLIANALSFSSRLASAAMTAAVFTILFGLVLFLGGPAKVATAI